MDARPPDWAYWSARNSARLWECLALSVDVEPRDLGVDHFLVMRSSESGTPLLGSADPDWLRQVCERLGPLYKALEDPPSGLRAGRKKAVAFDAELKLDGFAGWARSRKWQLPEALSELAPGEGKGKPAASKSTAPTAKAEPAAPKSKALAAKAKPAASKSKAPTGKAKPAASRSKASAAKGKSARSKSTAPASKAKSGAGKAAAAKGRSGKSGATKRAAGKGKAGK